MNRIYRNFGIALLFTTAACSTDNTIEGPFLEGPGTVIDGSISPNPYWGWVMEFPGFIPANLPRVSGDVTLQSQQEGTAIQTRFRALGWQSSGYYAAPGETITVTVPSGVNGLRYRIGGFNDILEEGATLKRYANMDVEGELLPGENKVLSYFGGHLYFFYAVTGSANTLQVAGVIKSPDFILGETDPAAWKQEIANTIMTYAELRSEKIILTLPVSILKLVNDPEALLDFYGVMLINDYDGFYATSAQVVPWRLRTDVQLSGSAMSSTSTGGYPAVILNSADSAIIRIVELKDADILKICRSFAYIYQEENLAGEDFGDAFLNLPFHQMYHRNKSWPSVNTEFEGAIQNYMTKNDPARRFNDLISGQKVGMFIQLAQQYGWHIFPYIIRQVRESGPASAEQDKNDALAMFATEYAGQNLFPFFEAWGFGLSSYARSYMKQFPEVASPFWNNVSREPGDFSIRTPVVHDRGVRPSHNAIDRSEWVVTAKRVVNGEEEDNVHVENDLTGKAANMIDGNAASIWHSKWENEKAQYPHVISIDMKVSKKFNYICYRQRNTQSDQNKCRRFQLFVMDTSGAWVGIEDNKIFTIGKETGEQRIYLNNTYETTQLKLNLVSPHPQAGKPYSDAPNQPLAVSVAEFGIGMFE